MSIVRELPAEAGCLKEFVCLAVAGLVTGVCCLLEDDPFAIVGLETGVGCLIEDDFLAAVAFGDIDGFFTLVFVYEDDAVVLEEVKT